MEALIIEAALNGATPRERQRHVPREPAEITADALACLDAGAAIIHSATRGLGVVEGIRMRRGSLAVERCGHVRVGLEDYSGTDQPTNRHLVEQVARIARAVGRKIADSREAARILEIRR